MSSKTDELYIGGKHIAGLDIENVEIGFDEETLNYYADCRFIAIGLGKTKEEALEDLRQAGHFGVDSLINLKLLDIRNKYVKTTGALEENRSNLKNLKGVRQ